MDLRPAVLQDAILLYQWRVEGETADWYEGPHTTPEDHRAWLRARLGNPLVRIWMVEVDDVPVGVVRLNSNDEFSVEIDPSQRGQGYGTQAIILACRKANGRVKACVDSTNDHAHRAFTSAGFQHRPDVHFYIYRP